MRDTISSKNFKERASRLGVNIDDEEIEEIKKDIKGVHDFEEIDLGKLAHQLEQFGVIEDTSAGLSCFLVRLTDYLIKHDLDYFIFIGKIFEENHIDTEKNMIPLKLLEDYLWKKNILDHQMKKIPMTHFIANDLIDLRKFEAVLSRFITKNDILVKFRGEEKAPEIDKDLTMKQKIKASFQRKETLKSQMHFGARSEAKKPTIRKEFTIVNYKRPEEKDVSDEDD